jgi:hypothetical protein
VTRRKIFEIANAIPAPQEGRIHIEKLNGPMLFEYKATPGVGGHGFAISVR